MREDGREVMERLRGGRGACASASPTPPGGRSTPLSPLPWERGREGSWAWEAAVGRQPRPSAVHDEEAEQGPRKGGAAKALPLFSVAPSFYGRPRPNPPRPAPTRHLGRGRPCPGWVWEGLTRRVRAPRARGRVRAKMQLPLSPGSHLHAVRTAGSSSKLSKQTLHSSGSSCWVMTMRERRDGDGSASAASDPTAAEGEGESDASQARPEPCAPRGAEPKGVGGPNAGREELAAWWAARGGGDARAFTCGVGVTALPPFGAASASAPPPRSRSNRVSSM